MGHLVLHRNNTLHGRRFSLPEQHTINQESNYGNSTSLSVLRGIIFVYYYKSRLGSFSARVSKPRSKCVFQGWRERMRKGKINGGKKNKEKKTQRLKHTLSPSRSSAPGRACPPGHPPGVPLPPPAAPAPRSPAGQPGLLRSFLLRSTKREKRPPASAFPALRPPPRLRRHRRRREQPG